MFHARCQRSQPRAAPRLDAALPLPLHGCSPVPSSALWNNRFVRDEQHQVCIGAVCLSSWLAADTRPGQRVHSELIEKRRAKGGRQVVRSTLPTSQPLSVALGSLTGSTNRGQRPRMAGLKRTMLDLETGGMCANAAVRWRSQACGAACLSQRDVDDRRNELQPCLAELHSLYQAQWPLLKSACQKQALLTVQWAVQGSIMVPILPSAIARATASFPPCSTLSPPSPPPPLPPECPLLRSLEETRLCAG